MNHFLQEIDLFSPELKTEGYTRVFVYHGPSMQATFRDGQLLFVRPTEKNLCPGDVIVFSVPGRCDPVVHRVIEVSPAGLITCGDNNSESDLQPVKLDQVLGRVEMTADHDRLQKILNGGTGLRRARMLAIREKITAKLKRFFWSPYDCLRKSGWVARLWRPVIIKVNVHTPQGWIIKYVAGKRTVAVWNQQKGFLECKKPFDLVIQPPV